MAIKYRMVERTDNINPEDEKKTGYYPRVVRNRTIKVDEISELAAEGTTINKIELKASIGMLMEHIEKELLNSNHVCIDGFGTFSLTAESRRVENPDEIRAESITVKRIVFTPSKTLMKRIKNAKFVRTK